MSSRRPWLALAGICVLAPVVAAPSGGSLAACAQVTDPTQRLACYDQLAGVRPATSAPTPATPAAASTPATAAAVKSDPVADFGVSEGPLARQRTATGLSQISAQVKAIGVRGYGQKVMTLDNGQVWLQLEPNSSFDVNVGDTVQIKSAALGSFFMTTPAKRGAKVTRIH